MSINIFLFHRDLRLEDNEPLQLALKKGPVLPVFIFTPEQVSDRAPIRSIKSIACLLHSLRDLNDDLEKHFHTRLHIFYGDIIGTLNNIRKHYEIESLFETKDYTPYAKLREQTISKWCESNKINYEAHEYLYLFPLGTIKSKTGKVYQKFTPFYEAASKHSIPKPEGLVKGKFVSDSKGLKYLSVSEANKAVLKGQDPGKLFYEGGRKEGLKLLHSLPENYNKTHDMMAVETSGLSVHHHNGTVSVRESYWIAKNHSNMSEFVRQLFWRDFYGQIVAFFEELYKENPYTFQSKWASLTPKQSKDFSDWCNGTTGIEIIDAGMTQLNTVGYMHNRARLVTASYLVKTLHIPWRYGEQYFANHLLDYDFTQNFCNWCFISSVLPFSEAPFRKHSPENYQKRFDPEFEYVNTYL